MLRLLRDQRRGLQHPCVLQRAVATRRAMGLELSQTREICPIHRGGVLALAIERVDGRYLLSGGRDHRIAVYDLEQQDAGGRGRGGDVAAARGGHGGGMGTAGQRAPRSYGTGGDPHTVEAVAVSSAEHHKFSVSALAWYPHDTGMFVSAGMDGCVKVCQLAANTVLLPPTAPALKAIPSQWAGSNMCDTPSAPSFLR